MIEENNKNTVGYRIKQIRKALNKKGKELATRLKISGPSLSEIERGKYYPNFEFMFNIAREFNLNLYYLILGEGEMFEERGVPLNQRLQQLCKQNRDVFKLLDYFEKSEIIRYHLLGQFKTMMLKEKEVIEKEILEGNEEK